MFANFFKLITLIASILFMDELTLPEVTSDFELTQTVCEKAEEHRESTS